MRTNRLISTLAALAMATIVAVSEAQALEGPLTTGSPAQGTWIGEAENRATSNTDQLAHQTAQVRLNIGKDGALDGYAPGSGCKLHGQVHPGNHASRLKLDLTVHDCKNAALNGQLKDGEIGLPTPKTAVIKINGRNEANGAKRYITFGAKLARLESADQAKAQPVPYIKAQPEARRAVDLTVPSQANFMAQTAAKPEVQPEIRTAAKPELHSKSKAAAKPEARSKSKATAKSEACAKSKTAAKTDARAKSKAAAKTDACAKSKAVAKTEARAKSKAAATTDVRIKSKAAAKTEAHSKSKTAAKSPAHPKTKPAAKTEARPKAHAKA